MRLQIDGENVKTEQDFHSVFSKFLGIQNYYGNNLHALWDVLSTGVERPFHIDWNHSDISIDCLGNTFFQIVEIFEKTRCQDEKYGWKDKFTYQIK